MLNNPQIEVHALAMITDPQGNLLLAKLSESPYWFFPGGTLKPGESIKSCLQRGILDPYAILLESVALVHVFSGEELCYTDDSGLRVSPVYMLFSPTKIRGSLNVLPLDGSELRFFAPWNIQMAQIFPPMRPAVRFFVDTYANERSGIDWDRLPNLID